jgi:DNA-directed RNA polymerase specialized sigma24 family protein
MTREEALAELSELHRELLELIATGVDHDAIAARLGLEPAAVAPLVVVAHRKLDRILSTAPHEENHAPTS